MPRLLLVFTAVTFAACNDGSPRVTGVASGALKGVTALAAKSGGGTAVFAYTVSGDVSTSGAPSTARGHTDNPFLNLSTSPATLTLESPTGDTTKCKTAKPSETFAVTFGTVAGTSWRGTLTIPNTANLSFNGTDDAGRTMQFTMADLTGGPTLTLADAGSATYAYTDAALYFGATSVAHDGLFRCVNITVTANPS
jgi:hypothetical protein